MLGKTIAGRASVGSQVRSAIGGCGTSLKQGKSNGVDLKLLSCISSKH
jgi:hypothetical protein